MRLSEHPLWYAFSLGWVCSDLVRWLGMRYQSWKLRRALRQLGASDFTSS